MEMRLRRAYELIGAADAKRLVSQTLCRWQRFHTFHPQIELEVIRSCFLLLQRKRIKSQVVASKRVGFLAAKIDVFDRVCRQLFYGRVE